MKIKEECASKYANFDVLPVATDVSKEDQA